MPLSAALLCLTAFLAQVPVPVTGGGIQIAEPDNDRWTRYIEYAGLDTLQVTLYADQERWDGSDLHFAHDAWHKLPGVMHEVRAAKARGLKVLLVLRVRLVMANPRNRHLWHGMIWPTDDALEGWFDAYRQFARWGAGIAEALDADVLLIGHELNSMTTTVIEPHLPDLLAYHLDPQRTAEVVRSRMACAEQVERAKDLAEPDGRRFATLEARLLEEDAVRRRWAQVVSGHTATPEVSPAPMPPALAARRARYARFWRSLIDDLRSVYRGPMGYGANFDQFEQVDFWDAMDVIGISSYFSLRPLDVDDLDAALEDGWRRVAARIEAVAEPAGRPVILHELGWSRRMGSTIRPYGYKGVTPIETVDGGLACIHWATQPDGYDERVRSLWALYRVVEAGLFPSLRGFSLWKMTTEPAHEPHEYFAVVLPLPFLERRADYGYVQLAADLLSLLHARVTD